MPATVFMVYHDDWIVNVLLSNGEVFAFVTEMWPEHGCEPENHTDWTRVERRAKNEALMLSARGARPYCRVTGDLAVFTLEQFHAATDEACRAMSDSDFRALMRH